MMVHMVSDEREWEELKHMMDMRWVAVFTYGCLVPHVLCRWGVVPSTALLCCHLSIIEYFLLCFLLTTFDNNT
jgi:hypothetical protein